MAEERQVFVVKHVYNKEPAVAPETAKEDPEKKKWFWTRILEARQRNADWSEILQILLESCLVLIIFIIDNLIGIIFLILGIVFLNDCPINQSIPISMIVYGVFTIIHGITLQLIQWQFCDFNNRKDGCATCALIIIIVSTIITLVAFIWACYTVFSIAEEVQTARRYQKSEKYCNGILYWFTYWFFIFMFILFVIFLIVFCCLICFIIGASGNQPSKEVIIIHDSKPADQHQT